MPIASSHILHYSASFTPHAIILSPLDTVSLHNSTVVELTIQTILVFPSLSSAGLNLCATVPSVCRHLPLFICGTISGWPGTQQHLALALSAGIASMSRHAPAVYISSVVHASRVHITCPGMLWGLSRIRSEVDRRSYGFTVGDKKNNLMIIIVSSK